MGAPQTRCANRIKGAVAQRSSFLDYVAPGFAKRWNGSVFSWGRNGNLNTCFADFKPSLQQATQLTPLFDDAPQMAQLPPWTAEGVLSCIPNGNLGLDGITNKWLPGLPADDLSMLARLLSEADEGRRPDLWHYAIVTLIPKGPIADADDLRPISVFSCTYRLWAARHARHLNGCLSAWKPDGLSGAVAATGAADVLRIVNSCLRNASLRKAMPVMCSP